MKKITCCEKINIVNIKDKKYYYHCYNISIGVSNALYYVFRVYANNDQDALDILADYLVSHNARMLYFTPDDFMEMGEDIGSDEFLWDYIPAGNANVVYFNAGYINMTMEE